MGFNSVIDKGGGQSGQLLRARGSARHVAIVSPGDDVWPPPDENTSRQLLFLFWSDYV